MGGLRIAVVRTPGARLAAGASEGRANDFEGIGGAGASSIFGREVSVRRSVPLTLGLMGKRPLVFRRVGRGVSRLSLLSHVSSRSAVLPPFLRTLALLQLPVAHFVDTAASLLSSVLSQP